MNGLAGLIRGRLADIFDPLFLAVRSLWLATISGGRPHEADISSSEPQASAQARVSRPDEDPRGPADHQSASPERPQAPGRVDPEEVGRVAGGRYRFPRAARVRRKSEIRALYRRGKRRRTKHLDVFVTDSPALRPRVAVVVPKHSRSGVQRNRLKRRLREGARLELLPRCMERAVALDVLIRARPEAYDAAYEQLIEEIRAISKQLC